jgi:hypothetical protein
MPLRRPQWHPKQTLEFPGRSVSQPSIPVEGRLSSLPKANPSLVALRIAVGTASGRSWAKGARCRRTARAPDVEVGPAPGLTDPRPRLTMDQGRRLP